MDIKISEESYHIKNLTKNEEDFVNKVYISLLKKYPKLKENIFAQLKDIRISPTDIVTGFLYSLRKNDYNEDQLLKKLKTYFNTYLPLIVDNAKEIVTSHFVTFEPKIVVLLHYVNYITRKFALDFDEQQDKGNLSEHEIFVACDFIALARALKSSIILFSIGDDVHGIGLYRGCAELLGNLSLANQFSEDYVKYKKYNIYLQLQKLNREPLPKEMIDDLGKYSNDENYIKYAWAKGKNGKRISRMADFVKLAFGNHKNVEYFIHLSSEFIHEDYNGVPYDYIGLREQYLNMYYEIAKSSTELIERYRKKFNKYNQLFKQL